MGFELNATLNRLKNQGQSSLLINIKAVFLKNALFYADVILPLALDKPMPYAVEKEDYFILKPGFRVAVSLGKTKIYTGVVLNYTMINLRIMLQSILKWY